MRLRNELILEALNLMLMLTRHPFSFWKIIINEWNHIAGVSFVLCVSCGIQGSLSWGEYSVPWHFPAGLKVYSQMSARRGLGRWPATLPVLSLLISVLLSLNRQVFPSFTKRLFCTHTADLWTAPDAWEKIKFSPKWTSYSKLKFRSFVTFFLFDIR